jgi:hypothetical protein
MNPEDSILQDDNIEDRLWDSPTKPSHDTDETPKVSGKHHTSTKPTYEEQQVRDGKLRQELESVRQVNVAIEGVIQSLGKARDNMKVWRGIERLPLRH